MLTCEGAWGVRDREKKKIGRNFFPQFAVGVGQEEKRLKRFWGWRDISTGYIKGG